MNIYIHPLLFKTCMNDEWSLGLRTSTSKREPTISVSSPPKHDVSSFWFFFYEHAWSHLDHQPWYEVASMECFLLQNQLPKIFWYTRAKETTASKPPAQTIITKKTPCCVLSIVQSQRGATQHLQHHRHHPVQFCKGSCGQLMMEPSLFPSLQKLDLSLVGPP